MTKRNSILFFTGTAIVVFILFIMIQNIKKDYQNEYKSVAVLEKEALALSHLKSRYKDKNSIQKAIASLKRIYKPAKDIKKAKVQILQFSNISQHTLNQLMRKVVNSAINIKKIDITREKDSSATLYMEIVL